MNKAKNVNQPDKVGVITWFEIPATNFERAVGFYNQVFGTDLEISGTPTHRMAFFPENRLGIGGAVVCGEGSVPNSTGSLIYFDCGADLDAVLAKVQLAGGLVQMEKTLISEELGHYALSLDSEGNRIALHSPKQNAAGKKSKPIKPAKSAKKR